MFFMILNVILYVRCGINIILKGRHGTLKSGVWYSQMSVFSFIVVLLNFLKYLRSVLFPKIVVSAFVGLVLFLCHNFSCLMARSRFWYFYNNSSVTFSVVGRLNVRFLIGVWCQVGHVG